MGFSTLPFKSLLDLLKTFPNEQACIDHLELNRWEGNVVSPFDHTSKVYKCGGNKYRCAKTKKYFNARTGTIFEGTKIPLQQWYIAIYLFSSHKKGISSHQLARDLNVTQKSAWFMLQRIRFAMENGLFTSYMEGIVEVDETFVGGRNKNRHKDKKVKNSQGRSFKDKTPVLGMLNREGNLKCVVVPDTSSASIEPIIRQNVQEGSIIMSDEWWAYRNLSNGYHI